MPFYQMVCIAAHYKEYRHIKNLVETCAKHVMDRGGVVRKIESWGTCTLPQRMKKSHEIGDYWTMNFDASPPVLNSLRQILHYDPRVLRMTTLKLGDRVEDVVKPKTKTLRDLSSLSSNLPSY
ncbi:ribosomal protein S6 [Irpex rosettiformis]|uniref:Ribosomal protein S6 n=1 Tax=Irpex rosettiformis TaxID=378272 RepID=A0ACB8UH20_9APHY|nr:ribosomal protein S6 [Irpex rosettiformis]